MAGHQPPHPLQMEGEGLTGTAPPGLDVELIWMSGSGRYF